MSWTSLVSILISICLSSAAQLLMKAGMASPSVNAALAQGHWPTLLAVATSPWVVLGLACFGLSAGIWLLVLARVDLSQAYPFVALGIVITTASALLWFGEPVSIGRLAGVALIAGGVLVVALS